MPVDPRLQDHRRKAIYEIMAEQPIRRQIELGRALRKIGFRVTQSSISRDLKAMGIVRRGGVYHLPEPRGDASTLGKLEEFIRSARKAGPYMLVLETSPGTAKAVSVAIKTAVWPEVMGILAEDETIFIATDNVYDTRLLFQRLRRILKV